MIEMRWLQRSTGEQVINKYGMFTSGLETVLQYRQIMNQTHWSEWQDVPTVQELPINTSKYSIDDKE